MILDQQLVDPTADDPSDMTADERHPKVAVIVNPSSQTDTINIRNYSERHGCGSRGGQGVVQLYSGLKQCGKVILKWFLAILTMVLFVIMCFFMHNAEEAKVKNDSKTNDCMYSTINAIRLSRGAENVCRFCLRLCLSQLNRSILEILVWNALISSRNGNSDRLNFTSGNSN